jgi:integrase
MARSASTDTRFLELHSGKWRVVITVPRRLQSKLGTKLKRALDTDSLAIANVAKWPVIAELKGIIAEAQGEKPDLREARTRAALNILRRRQETIDPLVLDEIDDEAMYIAAELLGDPIGTEIGLDGVAQEVFEPSREAVANSFIGVASGRAVPIDLHRSAYLAQLKVKPRTRADDERAIDFLTDWCKANSVHATLQAITRKVAMRFVDAMTSAGNGRSPVTMKKYFSRLSIYWQWLLQREHVEINPWQDIKRPTDASPHDEKERPFARDEMLALLSGPASPAMHDLMRIGALTGARLDAIVCLTVKDCQEGLFMFKPQKKEPAPRAVPIHSDLQAIVAARVAGKSEGDDLFPEWPPPKSSTSLRERSFKASNAFTAYRRGVGVDDCVAGKRRSLVNFHSFRRWFITEAERAGQPEHIIAAVVGHKRQGMTLGRYSSGPAIEQARACVEAVRLPTAEYSSVPEADGAE